MSFDNHHNFSLSAVATAPSPATSGTSLTITTGDATIFPAAPFNCTVWPSGSQPTLANAEIVRVTAIVGDVFTITRAQEGTTAQAITAGYLISATITKKTVTDIEGAMPVSGSWSITNGVDHESVTGLGLSFTPSRVCGLSISRPSGGLNLRANDVPGTLTSGGFAFELDGVTDSGSYVLNFIVFP